jgi:hypothetical protein
MQFEMPINGFLLNATANKPTTNTHDYFLLARFHIIFPKYLFLEVQLSFVARPNSSILSKTKYFWKINTASFLLNGKSQIFIVKFKTFDNMI